MKIQDNKISRQNFLCFYQDIGNLQVLKKKVEKVRKITSPPKTHKNRRDIRKVLFEFFTIYFQSPNTSSLSNNLEIR